MQIIEGGLCSGIEVNNLTGLANRGHGIQRGIHNGSTQLFGFSDLTLMPLSGFITCQSHQLDKFTNPVLQNEQLITTLRLVLLDIQGAMRKIRNAF